MAYISERGSSTLIRSWINQIGENCVSAFRRDWPLGEAETYSFTVQAPRTPILAGHWYEIWADRHKTTRMGVCYVLGANPAPYGKNSYAADGSTLKLFTPYGVGPGHILKRKRINIDYRNTTLSEFARLVVERGAVEYGLSSDFHYLQTVDTPFSGRFINKTPDEILEKLRDYGVNYYVDEDFKFHFFEDKNELLGYKWNDQTTYLGPLQLSQDISDLRNAVKIFGADIAKDAPDLTIEGTGDLTTGLDFPLPYNVVFDENLLLEGWEEINDALWQIADPKGSTSPDSPDGSRVWVSNGVLVVDGGSGIDGNTHVQTRIGIARNVGTQVLQTVSFDNFGDGLILGFSNGNNQDQASSFGVYLKSDGTITIREFGTEYAPSSTIAVKRSFSDSTALALTNLSVDRKSFDVPTGYGQYFSTGDVVTLIGNGIGAVTSAVTGVATNRLKINDAIPDGDFTGTKLSRIVDYRLRITVKAQGFDYEIQGGAYGGLNSGVYRLFRQTTANTTAILYPLIASPQSASCKFQIQDTFIIPSGSATFTLGGRTYPVVPESFGQAFDFPVLLKPADSRRNPPLFRYRPSRLIATVSGSSGTTTQFDINQNNFNEVFIGDRLLINKQETFITGKTAPKTITVSPALSAAPTDNTFIYVGTTAAALGQNGVLKYKQPIANMRYFGDQESIDQYGLLEDRSIRDSNLRSFSDLQARWEAFRDAKARPAITGQVTFEIAPEINR